MVQFDAVDILTGYVNSPLFQSRIPSGTISIKLLVSPSVDEAMLPWETLLSSPYFPEFHSADRKITNADITKSLTEWTSSKPGHLLKEVKHAIVEVEDLPGQSDIQPDVAVGWIVEYLDCFKNCKLPRWRQCIREVVSQLQSLSKGDWKTLESQRLMYNITIDLHSLKDNAMFFKSLQKMVFTGSLHCEACLVSLLALSTSYTSWSNWQMLDVS